MEASMTRESRLTPRHLSTELNRALASARIVNDSLAGRMRTIKLWPMTVSEISNTEPNHILDWGVSKSPNLADIGKAETLSRADYIDLILRGGFPEMRELETRDRNRQYQSYVDSVVDRDVADILRVRKSDSLRRMIDQLAARTANEINVTTLTKLIGVSRVTADDYLDVLTRLSMIVKLPAWTSSESKRDIKQANIDDADLKHLRNFAKDGPGKSRQFTGIVFYLGEHKLTFGDNIFALPVSALWATP